MRIADIFRPWEAGKEREKFLKGPGRTSVDRHHVSAKKDFDVRRSWQSSPDGTIDVAGTCTGAVRYGTTFCASSGIGHMPSVGRSDVTKGFEAYIMCPYLA